MFSSNATENLKEKDDETEFLNRSNLQQSVDDNEKKKKIFRFRFLPKFDEYREKKIFIDCQFAIENEEIYAHRIVLSKFSKIFLQYFSRISDMKSIINVPIPFNINNLFPQMIDFFYKEKLVFEDPIPFLMMAIVYDVPSLLLILDDKTNESLSIFNVLSYAAHFKNVRLDPTYRAIFPGISDSFQRMINRSLQFAPLIAENFKTFPVKFLYKSLSPQLLAEVLMKTDFDDKERISLIDDYVEQNGYLSTDECNYLQNVINWESEDSYRLLVDHKANWVSPSIALGPLSTIFNNRRKTVDSIIDFIGKNDKKCSNWYLMQWITAIKNSNGDNKLKDYELLNFTSTIGGSISNPVNPTLYRFIRTKASESLQIPQYRELLFDRECFADDSKKYFLSYPCVNESQTQSIGYEFEIPCYIPKEIIYRPVEKKPYPLMVVGKALDTDENVIYCSPTIPVKNDTDEIIIHLNVDIPIKSVVLEMVGNNSSDANILRASCFNIVGHFVPS